MIYKPRCEYATTKQKGGALHCEKVNGYCGFQYRCEQTGQWENTPTAKGCKARKPKEETKILSSDNRVAEMQELPKGAELSADQKFHGEETTVEKIADNTPDATQPTKQADALSNAFSEFAKLAEQEKQPTDVFAGALESANTYSTSPTEPVSERSKVTDEVERYENQTARRASGTKRGRRKKCDNVPSDAAQESTGGTADERLHPEGGTVSE